MCVSLDRFWWTFLGFLLFLILIVLCCGCGASAKSEMPVKANTKMIEENKTAIKGNENKINTNSIRITNVSNDVTSNNEALEKSFKNEIGKVGRDVLSTQENVTNSMWYAFGVLIIIGAVGLLGLVIVLYFYRGFKLFGRK